MASGPSISMRYPRRVIETAKAAGVDERALLAAAPLTPFDHYGDARVSGEQYYALWAAAMERVKDPAFPLRVAKATGIETYEIFGFAIMTSSTFREGLQHAARYLQIWTDLASWELREEGGR